jgi:hypothetical protein
MDIVGPFPNGTQGNKYILVVQDHFTKWTEAYALPDCSAKTVAHVFVYEFVRDLGPHWKYTQIKAEILKLNFFRRCAGYLEPIRPAQPPTDHVQMDL